MIAGRDEFLVYGERLEGSRCQTARRTAQKIVALPNVP